MKALSPIAVLLSALLLQGCVAAAVVGTAAVGTKAATDPRSVGTQVDDGTLEVRVNSALQSLSLDRLSYRAGIIVLYAEHPFEDGLSGQSAAGWAVTKC